MSPVDPIVEEEAIRVLRDDICSRPGGIEILASKSRWPELFWMRCVMTFERFREVEAHEVEAICEDAENGVRFAPPELTRTAQRELDERRRLAEAKRVFVAEYVNLPEWSTGAWDRMLVTLQFYFDLERRFVHVSVLPPRRRE